MDSAYNDWQAIVAEASPVETEINNKNNKINELQSEYDSIELMRSVRTEKESPSDRLQNRLNKPEKAKLSSLFRLFPCRHAADMVLLKTL